MATLNKSILGKVSGTIGDITFRQRKNKNIVSVRPSSFMPGNDPDSIARREKFSLTTKLAKAVYSLQDIRSRWEAETPSSMLPFNHIMQSNYAAVEGGELSALVKLAPWHDFIISLASTEISAGLINLSVAPFGSNTGINAAEEPTANVLVLLYVNNPVDTSVEKNGFLQFVSESKPVTLTEALNFSVQMSSVESQLIGKYHNQKLFVAVVTKSAAGIVIGCSNTCMDQKTIP
ncbi:MAG: hypothetical protein PHP42_02565 [Bacteroidota bacterium]|nr:hypothetical protein [Bacteroidota bacterium]